VFLKLRSSPRGDAPGNGRRQGAAGLLIPLNECRRATFFLPWKCQDLRHAYEKCQYEEWKTRVELLKNQE